MTCLSPGKIFFRRFVGSLLVEQGRRAPQSARCSNARRALRNPLCRTQIFAFFPEPALLVTPTVLLTLASCSGLRYVTDAAPEYVSLPGAGRLRWQSLRPTVPGRDVRQLQLVRPIQRGGGMEVTARALPDPEGGGCAGTVRGRSSPTPVAHLQTLGASVTCLTLENFLRLAFHGQMGGAPARAEEGREARVGPHRSPLPATCNGARTAWR
jgi:hypothetical protein